jgi:hypothetical protein
MDISEFFKEKTSDIIYLLGTGCSINEITNEQWSIILGYDHICINSWYYHPTIIPKWCHLEIIGENEIAIARRRFEEKWEKGWKNVKYVIQKEAKETLLSVVGHLGNAQVYEYERVNRGDRKKIKNTGSDANFNPDDGNIYKSYCYSVTNIIHILYLMGYEKIICWGLDMNNSKYFWADMKPEVRGEVHKTFEAKSIDSPHGTLRIAPYIIDFNNRHMKPKDREIFVGHKTTALYPALKLWKTR